MSIICTCVNIHACIFWPCELDLTLANNKNRKKKKAVANFSMMSEKIKLMRFLDTCYWLSIILGIYCTDGAD